ncbi:MAG: hypothetical protein ABIL68_03775 [bacterium]
MGTVRTKRLMKDWGRTAFEILKWAVVLWLLWPMKDASSGPVNFTRIVAGILLFVIFAGKLFYDTVIMGIIRQRRTSVKQDIVNLLGIVMGVGIVVGLLIFFVGFILVELFRSMNRREE